ncbi:MAG TPA: PAS-domain containing protein [Xanthobacteraceae bacterium]
MPDTIRITGGSIWFHRWRSGYCTAIASGLCRMAPVVAATPVRAQDTISPAEVTFGAYVSAISQLDRHEIAALALTLGILCFAVVTAIMLVRTRRRLAETEAAARDQALSLRARADRANALLQSEPQVVIAWSTMDEEPEIIGEPSLVTDMALPDHVLGFGSWLDPEQAHAIENAVEALRARGVGFGMTLTTLSDRLIEADGQAIGGRAVLRLRNVSGIRHELGDLLVRHHKQIEETEALRTLIDAVTVPVWARDASGRLAFANKAYAVAVEARDGTDAVERGAELFDRAARAGLLQAEQSAHPYRGRLPAIVAGSRRSFEVQSFPSRGGSAAIGIDVTEADRMRTDVARMAEAHRRTLDQLTTGVAIFGSNQKLAFYNAAYRSLWDLDAGFLDQEPSDLAVLDRLRAARKLPEEQDFRQWKAALHDAYHATEAREHMWHLPDGRTLRVVTTPNAEGGVIYLFDDVTERLDLARRYDALIRVQGETLDNLAEAVAVFGSDGRLRLFNPVFARLWKLLPATLAERPHIETVIGWCQPLSGEGPLWRRLRAAITAIDDREQVSGRIERRDGSVIDCATVPLPDGATLVTFQDVTDTVNVERALREKNDALEEADEIKVDFVHHVSYELRSPLTNIIGFAHFLGDLATGPLNEKQKEYLGYITTSTNALLAIINNILDLASIDAGAMTLDLGPVDIKRTMHDAAEGVQDRLLQSDISLKIRVAPDIGSFVADERRVRQTLFNLLSNAIGFSPAGETITLSAQRLKDAVVFSVTDHGPGIPADVKDKVFDWFETHSLGSRHRGTGLGLSLVRSFVELHGGTVTIDSAVGTGTTVTCVFPLGQLAERPAA